MKRVIVGLLLGAFCCALLATPSTPLGRDPRLPSTSVYENTHRSRSTGEESGWADPHQVPYRDGNDRHQSIWGRLRGTNLFHYLAFTAILRSVAIVFTIPDQGNYETGNQLNSD